VTASSIWKEAKCWLCASWKCWLVRFTVWIISTFGTVIITWMCEASRSFLITLFEYSPVCKIISQKQTVPGEYAIDWKITIPNDSSAWSGSGVLVSTRNGDIGILNIESPSEEKISRKLWNGKKESSTMAAVGFYDTEGNLPFRIHLQTTSTKPKRGDTCESFLFSFR
jgi:hypothetical protein